MSSRQIQRRFQRSSQNVNSSNGNFEFSNGKDLRLVTGKYPRPQQQHRRPVYNPNPVPSNTREKPCNRYVSQTQICCEEDEQSTVSIHRYSDQRWVLRVIGGYPAFNGGLDSGNPNTPLLVTNRVRSPCLSTTFQRG